MTPEAKCAKELVAMIFKGIKHLPVAEQRKRVVAFCASLRASMKKKPKHRHRQDKGG